MEKKQKQSKFTDKEAGELLLACRLACGGHPIDEFLDRVFEKARLLRARRAERGELSLTE